jgi:hypothetical protein
LGGSPDEALISTSYVEWFNLSMRMLAAGTRG